MYIKSAGTYYTQAVDISSTGHRTAPQLQSRHTSTASSRVNISNAAQQLSRASELTQGTLGKSMPSLITISRTAIKTLSNELENRLKAFERNLPTSNPDIKITIKDPNKPDISITGSDKDNDLKKLENKINSDKTSQSKIHQLFSIASHIPGAERSEKYQNEYRTAKSSAEINRVNAKYSDLLSGKPAPADLKLVFNRSGITFSINGKEVS